MTYVGEELPDGTHGPAGAKWPWAVAALVVAAVIAVVIIVLTGGSGDPIEGPTYKTPTATDTPSATDTATLTTTETQSTTPTPTHTTSAVDDDLLLRPDGLGAITIGMSEADASATGTIGALETPGPAVPQCYTAERTTDDHAKIFFLDDEVVVIYLDREQQVNPPVTTLEGISLESTPDEVMTVYPTIDLTPPRWNSGVPNYGGEGNTLVFVTNGQPDPQLQTITLESPKAECYN